MAIRPSYCRRNTVEKLPPTLKGSAWIWIREFERITASKGLANIKDTLYYMSAHVVQILDVRVRLIYSEKV